MSKRGCGTCTACCTVLAIEELDKPGFSRCPNECNMGCKQYANRPGSCRDFTCLWLQGHLGKEDRPDKLGVVFTTTGHPELGMIPLLIEVRQGAVQQTVIKNAVRRFLEHSPVAISTPAGGKLIRPTALTVKGKKIRKRPMNAA